MVLILLLEGTQTSSLHFKMSYRHSLIMVKAVLCVRYIVNVGLTVKSVGTTDKVLVALIMWYSSSGWSTVV